MADNRPRRASEAFFGRRHGKSIRPRQARALELLLPRYRIDLSLPAPVPLGGLFDVPVEDVFVEIGFGGGEFLRHEIGSYPARGFIGVEPFANGMAKMMAALDEASPAANLRVYDDDATRLLDWLPEGSISGIDLFYPDPWPKRRHWKRRFVNRANLDRFARVIRPGGRFRFASDIASYVNWTLLHCRSHDRFAWCASAPEDWRHPFPGWPGTRYEAKAIAQGREPAYLTFTRI